MKFFRKIRQRLLTENKFSKYLIYAIGEIILVVIGILIALQINNWNEKRIEAKKATDYLYEFQKDLASDKIQFNYMIKLISNAIEAELSLLQRKTNSMDSLHSIAAAIGAQSYQRSINKRSFDNVQNSGKSNLSGYEDLYARLSYYYTEINRDLNSLTQWDYEEYKKNRKKFDDFINNGNYEISLNYFEETLKELNVDSVTVFNSERQVPILDFINSISGRNYISINLQRHVIVRNDYKSWKKEATELLGEIEKELDKLK
jgi:hypothetical protein